MFKYVFRSGIVKNFKNLKLTNVKALSINNNPVQQPPSALLNSYRNYTKLSPNQQSCLHILQRRRFSAQKQNHLRDVPKLLYFQDPRKYVKTKLNLMKLRLLWDRSFNIQEFIAGSRKAAIVVTDLIRTQNPGDLEVFTTSSGFRQISRDMFLSKDDPRLQLIDFRRIDIKQAMPVRAVLLKRNGRKHCYIDMFFAGLRNCKDFDDLVTISSNLKRFYKMYGKGNVRTLVDMSDLDLQKIIFAEIVIRFYREYTTKQVANWAVSFYKVISFDVLTVGNDK